MATLIRVIELKYAQVQWYDNGEALSVFRDEGLHRPSSSFESQPHDTPHYRELAARIGYGADIGRYCQEHEVCHHLVAEWINDSASPVLYALAQGRKPHRFLAVGEEATTVALQRWVRAGERPILPRVNWDKLRDRALELMGDLSPSVEKENAHVG